MKIARFAAIYFGLFLIFSAVAFSIGAAGGSFETAGIVATLTLLMMITFIGTKVGYRWRDLALLAIPVVGVYFWVMWMWRLACLPDRYWDRPAQENAQLEAARTREMQADLTLQEYWREEVSRDRKREIHRAVLRGRQLDDLQDAALGIWIAGKRKQGLMIKAGFSATFGTLVLVSLWTDRPPNPSMTYRYWTGLALVWALVNPAIAFWLRHRAIKAELLNERRLARELTGHQAV